MNLEQILDRLEEKAQAYYPHPNVNAFKTTHHPYYFFSQEYMTNSAGTRTMYTLCHILNECGFEAYVIADKPIVGMRTPILTCEVREKHREEGRHPIAVYNETGLGNPLEGDVVVRWIMNKKVYIDGKPIPFSKNDLLFYWDRAYAETEIENADELRSPIFDRSIFNTGGSIDKERSGFCYYAHKYLQFNNGKVKLPEILTKTGTSLCQDIKRTPYEIADIFRRSKILYCYEPSAIMAEAMLCGCPAVYIKTDYLNNFTWDEHIFTYPMVREDQIDIHSHNADAVSKVFDEWIGTFYESKKKKYGSNHNGFVSKTQKAAQDYKKVTKKPDRLTSFCKKHNPLYIYGGGVIARQCYRVLKAMGLNVDGVVVSDVFENLEPVAKTFTGLNVYHLSEMESQKEQCGFVLAMAVERQDEVIKVLNERGFKNYIRHSLCCPVVGKS